MKDSSDRIIIAGGIILNPTTGNSIPLPHNQGAIYDPASDTWTSIANLPWSGDQPRYWNSGGHLWVADLAGPADAYTSTAWYSGGVSGTWTQMASTSPTDLTNTAQMHPSEPIAANGLVYIPGRFSYNMTTDTWATLSTIGAPLLPRTACSMSSDGRYIYHFTADGSPGSVTKRYDTQTDTWATMAPSPDGRVGGAVVTNGQFIYLFGGSGITTILEYDTINNSWRDTGDRLSVGRSPYIAKDTVGPGYYLVEGPVTSSILASNAVEYWNPPGAGQPVSATSSFGAIVGQ
jgi:hypothetical protein